MTIISNSRKQYYTTKTRIKNKLLVAQQQHDFLRKIKISSTKIDYTQTYHKVP